MKASQLVLLGGVAGLIIGGVLVKPLPKVHAPNPPDTAGFWQQANSAAADKCRLGIVLSVLRMKLPNEAYADPELNKAMQRAYTLCLKDHKVMI